MTAPPLLICIPTPAKNTLRSLKTLYTLYLYSFIIKSLAHSILHNIAILMAKLLKFYILVRDDN